MKKKIKLWIKILILPTLIGIFFILFYNGFILERIRHKINSIPDLKVEKISGNLFTHLDLRGVKFGKVFNASRILVRYTPISILKKEIKDIKIESPVIEIDVSDTGHTSIVSPFSIKSFVLSNGLLLNIPQINAVSFSDIRGSLEKEEGEQILHIKRGEVNIELKEKLINVEKVNGILSLTQDFIEVQELFVEVFGGKVSISGVINSDSLNFNLSGDNIQVQEIDENLKGIANLNAKIVKRADSLSIKGKAQFNNGKYKNHCIGNLNTDFVLLNRDLKLKIREWKLEEMNFSGDVCINLDSNPISYHAILIGEQIDLAKFLKTVPSNLAGKVEIEGKGEEFQSAIDLSGSIKTKRLRSMKAHIMYKPSEVEIVSLSMENEGGKILAQGTIYSEEVNLSLTGKDVELGMFYSQAGGVSNFELTIQGNIKNPGVFGTFYIKDFKSGKIKSDYFSGNLNLENLLPPKGEGEINLANLDLYGNKFESCKGIFSTSSGQGKYEIKARDDSINLELKGDGYEDAFVIRTFSFYSPDVRILNNKDIKIEFRKNQLNIKSCELLVNDSLVQVRGSVSKNKLALTMVGRNLGFHSFSDILGGNIYFTCNINGSIQSPIISLTSEISNFSYTGIAVDKIFAVLVYKDHYLHIERGDITKGEGTAKISGKFPVAIPFSTSDKFGKSIDIKLTFSNFGENIFFPYRKFAEIKKGNIDGKLRIKGKIKEPRLYGNLCFSGESMNMKILGTTLKRPVGKLTFEGNRIHINSFEGKTSDGFVKVAGCIQIPENLDLDIYTKNIKIRSIKDIDATVSANLSLEGSIKNPELKGNIEVKEAIVSMPFKKQASVNLQNPLDYDLTVNFPNKVWIKNSMVDAELEGKVKVKKEKEDFFISGNTKIKEGYFSYSFKGMFERQFRIDKGEFEFTNSPDINPKIDLSASTVVNYTVIADTSIDTSITRQDTVSTIKLQVTGTMRNPEVSLSSSPPMPMEDIISLLSLNMKAGDLLKLQKSQYAQTVGLKVVSSLILNEIVPEDLKSQIGVDVLRLEAELFGEEKTARFNIGKYILKDLYVSYTNDLFSPSKHNFKVEYSPWKYSSFVGERTDEGIRTGVQFKIRY